MILSHDGLEVSVGKVPLLIMILNFGANVSEDPSKSMWARWTVTADQSLDLKQIVKSFPSVYYFEVTLLEQMDELDAR